MVTKGMEKADTLSECLLHLGVYCQVQPSAISDPKRPEGEPEARKTCPRWRRIRLGDTETNRTDTGPDGMYS